MIIAIPVIENNGENSQISEHFGHSPFFAFYDTEKEKLRIENNSLEEHGPGDVPNFLYSKGVNVIIVRGIGQRAISFFEQLGIKVIRGASGSVKDIINAFLENKIEDKEYQVKEKFHNH